VVHSGGVAWVGWIVGEPQLCLTTNVSIVMGCSMVSGYGRDRLNVLTSGYNRMGPFGVGERTWQLPRAELHWGKGVN